jgi:formate/nitrite transporter FocA (FNT family)
MSRVVIPILSLVTAAATAFLFWIIAHDDWGIAVNTIRTDALASAGFILVVLAGASLLTRNK